MNLPVEKYQKSSLAAVKWIFYIVFSAIWAYYGSTFASLIGLDFIPIVETFDDIRQVDGLWDRFQYSLIGNSNLVFIYDLIFGNVDSFNLTLISYYFSSFIRSLTSIFLLGFGRAFLLLFAYEWVFDFNQSRLSLAMSFLFLGYFLKKKYLLIPAIASHLAVVPLTIYLLLSSRMRFWFVIIVILVAFFFVPIYFPRYFLNDFKDPVPLNTLIYGSLIIAMGITLVKAGVLVPEFLYFVVMLVVFSALMQIGFSAVYIGRIAEMVCYFILTRVGFVLNSKIVVGESVWRLNAAFILFSLLIFSYQTITIFGNVWRFFE